jgi:tRNA (adenine37-N6)-methyltransferase
MNQAITINPIGVVHTSQERFSINLSGKYIPALTGLQGFSHIQILWWGHMFATAEYRETFTGEKPYTKGPDIMGIFATRSPMRPNPVLITNVFVQEIDFKKGIIYTPYIDAEDGTPVLDIKPYHPSDRVREVSVPEWCSHWPKWDEDSAEFDWQAEFNFQYDD